MKELDHFYDSLDEPYYSCYWAIKNWILQNDENFTQEWKYQLPFFYYKKKPFCYLWKDSKSQTPYIGFSHGFMVEHFALEKGDRTRIKILRIDPDLDLPVEQMREIFELIKTTY